MEDAKKKRIPVREGLWVDAVSRGERPRLIASQCRACEEIFFPKMEKGWCVRCHKESLKDIKLNARGKIHTASVVMQKPGGGYYRGPVPYAYGFVNLPEGIRVESLFTSSDPDELEVGRDVELVVETLHMDEEGNEVMTFKFRPC